MKAAAALRERYDLKARSAASCLPKMLDRGHDQTVNVDLSAFRQMKLFGGEIERSRQRRLRLNKVAVSAQTRSGGSERKNDIRARPVRVARPQKHCVTLPAASCDHLQQEKPREL
jgi:hypothetical protein